MSENNQLPENQGQSLTAKSADSVQSVHKNTDIVQTIPSAQAPIVVQQSGGKGLAVGALVLSMLGLGASAAIFVQGQNLLRSQDLAVAQRLDNQEAAFKLRESEFNARMEQAAVGESKNALVLQEALVKQDQIAGVLGQLQGLSEQHGNQIANAHEAYRQLLKNRSDWLVDEAEATLNLASQQLLLSGDIPMAVVVLQNIQKRLDRFDYAELIPIKQAISHDLELLQGISAIDLTATSLRLERLENSINKLPLLVDSVLQPSKAAEMPQDNPQLSWWQNSWHKAQYLLKDIVEVRKIESSDAMLIAPEQTYFVRENLRLRLLNARSALMKRNGETYQNDLNQVETTIKQYFNPQSAEAQAFLKEVGELKGLDLSTGVTNEALKESLAAIRIYQENVRNTQNTATFSAVANGESEVKAAEPVKEEIPAPVATEPVVANPEPATPAPVAETASAPATPEPVAETASEPAAPAPATASQAQGE